MLAYMNLLESLYSQCQMPFLLSICVRAGGNNDVVYGCVNGVVFIIVSCGGM